MDQHKIFGVTGWKNSGKTTLLTRLVEYFSRHDLIVSTLKHAHHDFDIDHEGRDSWRHRQAGAMETVIVSGSRWALMHELRGTAEPAMSDMLRAMTHCDLILVEGYKRELHPKIEVLANDSGNDVPRWTCDDTIVALACDTPQRDCSLPCFSRDDIAGIADFIAGYLAIDLTARASRDVG